MKVFSFVPLCAALTFSGCADRILPDPDATNVAVKPRVVTTALAHDTDDPAIWINRADPSKSLVIGTDKDTAGGLYAFDLAGKIVRQTPALKRPNNVDILTGMMLGGKARRHRRHDGARGTAPARFQPARSRAAGQRRPGCLRR